MNQLLPNPIPHTRRASAGDAGDDDFARATEALRPDRSLRHPRLREAAALLGDERPDLARDLLERFLKARPRDADALHLLAEAATREGRRGDARELLARCVELAPGSASMRFNYANALFEQNRPDLALAQLEILLGRDAHNPLFRRLKATVLELTGDDQGSLAEWQALAEDYPDRPDCRVHFAHGLRRMGRREDAIFAYRKAIALNPHFGGAYWGLANLKLYAFTDAEIKAMEAALARPNLGADDRTRLLFSLGKAYGDRKLYAESFENYAKGNALHRLRVENDPDVLTNYVRACKRLFTAEFFRQRQDFGCNAGDAIFIVGMGRAGSTLVEQILASHSQIEGTRELFDLSAIAKHLENDVAPGLGADYPGVLGCLDAAAFRSLGEQYLASTHGFRKLGRPFFTDKMGSNFLQIAAIHLMLPNARIIDVRRHPLACCLSNFIQHFVRAIAYSYRQTELGRFYRDYVELMDHFDRVLPGKVHRVIYERLVANPESEVRHILDFLQLPFEETCLRFHENLRAVSTASSEQVRSPIFRDGLERWRDYEPWLGPLKRALGDVLEAYPDVPAFDRECMNG